jgi:hypothetical protein
MGRTLDILERVARISAQGSVLPRCLVYQKLYVEPLDGFGGLLWAAPSQKLEFLVFERIRGVGAPADCDHRLRLIATIRST